MNSKTMLKTLSALTISAVFSVVTSQSFADYPEETIRIVVPWKAGGGTDSIARALAEPMEKITGQTVLIENISGGSRVPAHVGVKDAPPDGYRMLLNGSSDISTSIVYRDVPFSLEDYTCVGGVYETPVWMLANTARGWSNFDDFIAAAKAKPGQLAVGVTALKTPDEVMVKMLAAEAGIDVRIIPFNGGAALKKAVIADQIEAGILYAPVMLAEIESGTANILVAGGPLNAVKYAAIRDTKTPADYGVDVVFGSYRGVLMPKGATPAIKTAAEYLVKKAAMSPEFATFGEKFGFAPRWVSGADYCNVIAKEMDVFKSVGN